MDAQTSLDNGASVTLRRQIEQTQTDLGAKIGALEGEVRAVTSHAREIVQERIDAIRRVVDVRGHVARYPLLSATLALGLGVALGVKRGKSEERFRVVTSPGVRSLLAPHVATLRTVLVGRALAYATDFLTDRLVRSRGSVREAEQPE